MPPPTLPPLKLSQGRQPLLFDFTKFGDVECAYKQLEWSTELSESELADKLTSEYGHLLSSAKRLTLESHLDSLGRSTSPPACPPSAPTAQPLPPSSSLPTPAPLLPSFCPNSTSS
ncbi:hypothetical protein JCM11641_004987 [Rhodosporidiobolus odoratus]